MVIRRLDSNSFFDFRQNYIRTKTQSCTFGAEFLRTYPQFAVLANGLDSEKDDKKAEQYIFDNFVRKEVSEDSPA